jgi:5-methylcytosine-specific restriction endonuclease McrA
MTDESEDYREERKVAFKRDDYTCQICGTVGFPKTDHGLAAVPAEPGEHKSERLVTVCHTCMKKDDQQLQGEVIEAFERRRRRSQQKSTERTQSNQPSTDTQPDETNVENGKLRSLWNFITEQGGPLFDSEYGSNRPDRYELADKVGKRDNFSCQVCGTVTRPRGRVGYMIFPLGSNEDDPRSEDYSTVCWDCFEWKDEQVVQRKTRLSSRLKSAPRGFSFAYAQSLLRGFKENTRLFIHTGRLVVLRRFVGAVASIILSLFLTALIAGAVGSLFVSPEAGVEWIYSTWRLYLAGWSTIASRPWIVIGGLGLGYLLHVYEQERAYKRELFRDQRRRGDGPSISYARPRWQFVAGFAALGLFGAVDWLLVQQGILPDGMRFGALVFWMTGTASVAYYLRYALREDRDIDGQPVNPAPWVFAARYALFVGFVGIGTSLLDTGSIVPSIVLALAISTAPLVGTLYVLRRYAEQRTRWGARLMRRVRTTLDRIRPWDDQWPPEPQHRQQTDTAESTADSQHADDTR